MPRWGVATRPGPVPGNASIREGHKARAPRRGASGEAPGCGRESGHFLEPDVLARLGASTTGAQRPCPSAPWPQNDSASFVRAIFEHLSRFCPASRPAGNKSAGTVQAFDCDACRGPRSWGFLATHTDRAKMALDRPKLASDRIDQTWPRVPQIGQHCPRIGQIGQISQRFGQTCRWIRQNWPLVGKHLSSFC